MKNMYQNGDVAYIQETETEPSKQAEPSKTGNLNILTEDKKA